MINTGPAGTVEILNLDNKYIHIQYILDVYLIIQKNVSDDHVH